MACTHWRGLSRPFGLPSVRDPPDRDRRERAPCPCTPRFSSLKIVSGGTLLSAAKRPNQHTPSTRPLHTKKLPFVCGFAGGASSLGKKARNTPPNSNTGALGFAFALDLSPGAMVGERNPGGWLSVGIASKGRVILMLRDNRAGSPIKVIRHKDVPYDRPVRASGSGGQSRRDP